MKRLGASTRTWAMLTTVVWALLGQAPWGHAQVSSRVDATATAVWELQIPDYPGFLAAADLPPELEQARSLVEFIRIVHRAPGDYDASARRLRERVQAHFRLAAGMATASVPSPLPPRAWRDLLPALRDERELPSALLADREASLMYLGLLSLDRETRSDLTGRRQLLRQLARTSAATFAAFSQALVLRAGRVVVPGGKDAEPLWSAIAGVDVTDPEQFVPVLFSQDAGRLAYFYQVVARSDAAHQRFLTSGGGTADGRGRDEFQATYALVAASDRAWDPAVRPFSRVAYDFESNVRSLRVDDAGRPTGPLWAELWDAAFGVSEPLANPRGGTLVSPAWIAARVSTGERPQRRDRLDALLFAQRVFADVDKAAAEPLVGVFRSFGRYRALYLTLERMGVREPALYRAAEQRVQHLRADGSDQAFVEHVLFQGSLALLERAVFFRSLDERDTHVLLRSLLAVEAPSGRTYRRPLLGWVAQQLAPTLARQVGTDSERLDETILRGVAGARATSRSLTVTYEELPYVVDPAGAEELRLRRVREQQAAMRLEPVVQFSDRLAALAAGAHDADSAEQNVRALRSLAKELREELVGLERGTSHANALWDDMEDAERVLSALSTRSRGEVSASALRTLTRFADRAAADAMLAWVYATALGDPQGAAIAGGDVARRHEFALRGLGDELRATGPWSLPIEQFGRNRGWRAVGSLLGLDIAFARLALRRLDGEYPSRPPSLTGLERLNLAQANALRSPFTLVDQDRDAVAVAVQRGRRWVSDLSPQTVERVEDAARQLRMDGWRRTAIEWSVLNDPAAVRSLFTLTEVYWLGREPTVTPPDAWGSSAVAVTGCWCLAFPVPEGWGTVTGRPGTGLLTTRFADVAIVAALALSDLGLPAQLAQGLAAMLTQTTLDYGQQSHVDDLVSLSAVMRELTRPDFEDYVATLTYDGPLRPYRSPETSSGTRE